MAGATCLWSSQASLPAWERRPWGYGANSGEIQGQTTACCPPLLYRNIRPGFKVHRNGTLHRIDRCDCWFFRQHFTTNNETLSLSYRFSMEGQIRRWSAFNFRERFDPTGSASSRNRRSFHVSERARFQNPAPNQTMSEWEVRKPFIYVEFFLRTRPLTPGVWLAVEFLCLFQCRRSLSFLNRYCTFQRNEPCALPVIVELIAAYMKRPVDEVAMATTFNSLKLFGLSWMDFLFWGENDCRSRLMPDSDRLRALWWVNKWIGSDLLIVWETRAAF